MKINFQIPNDNKYHQFCLKCYSEKINRIFKKEKTYYKCQNCKKISSRLLVIDPEIKWWIDDATKEYWHESVGIFVFNKNKKALFFERIIYPFALTIPAGHIDFQEKPEDAIKRELFEETMLKINNVKLFSEENVIGDRCRRGADNHKWHLYTIQITRIDNIELNDEGVKPVWLSVEEALTKDVVYPVRYFIDKYGKELLI